jgi:hypothetical protein
MKPESKRNEIECPNGLKVVWKDFEGFPSYEEFANSLKERAEMTIRLRGNPIWGGANIFNEIPPNPNPLVQILIDFRRNIVNEYKEKYEALLKEKEKEKEKEEEDSNCITW